MQYPLYTQRDRYLKYICILLGILLFTLLGCLLSLKHVETLEVKSSNNRYTSYKLAQELRLTSDDLTKMVHLYVITGDPKYRNYFNEILSIRNGTTPRPIHYVNELYWDLVLAGKPPGPYGEKKSLRDLMIEQGFTPQEFAFLTFSEARSNELTLTENKAMNAIEGKFLDSSGNYTIKGPPNKELAESLVFGQKYMDQKATIMGPIQAFFEAVKARTNQMLENLQHQVTWIITIAIALSAISAILLVICVVKGFTLFTHMAHTNELLLLNILPPIIVDRLKKGEETIADEYQASVFFADIVKFTELSAHVGAAETVNILNKLFDLIDALTELHGVEKIKTIGDSYMAVSGAPIPVTDHATRLANFALDVRKNLEEFNKSNNLHLELRIGMTSGTVVAGVLGHKKFIYDLWGDVVNVASRMESSDVAGEIQVTEKMAQILDEEFILQPRSFMDIKGKGSMHTYFLKGKK